MTAIIQSIQPFTITPTTGTTAGTAAITAVDTSKSVIFPNGLRLNSGSANTFETMMALYVLVSSVQVRVQKTVAFPTTATFTGTVVEFANFVNSIQSGTITLTTASTGATATINAVSTRAFILFQGADIQTVTSRGASYQGVTIINSTQVQAVATPSTLAMNIRFTVVDLSSDVVDSVQRIDLSTNAASSIDTATINSVDTGLSFIADGGQASSAQIAGAQLLSTLASYTAHLAGPTSVQFTRINGANTVVRRHLASVVTLKSQALASTIKRGTINVTTAGVTGTATIAAVSTRAHLNTRYQLGTPSSGGSPNSNCLTLTMASTLITATRFTTVNACPTRWEVIEWASSITLAPPSTEGQRRFSNLNPIEAGSRRGLHPIDHGARARYISL